MSTAELLSSHEICAGNLVMRLADSREEMEAAQALRYRVFYEEMGGIPSERMRTTRWDFDELDEFADHLLVLDRDLPKTQQVVGTYRLLRRSQMQTGKKFYSESEFNISAVKEEAGEILELSRSCVDAAYRKRSVIQLLFRGIGTYVARHNVKRIFGCASFFGTDIKEHALALSYLYHYHTAPQEIRPVALADKYVNINLMRKEEIDVKSAFASLPTIIKGYLRMNATIGDGAVIDSQFNTIDIGIVIKTELLSDKYIQRYSTASVSGE